jgi:hypothetical protein
VKSPPVIETAQNMDSDGVGKEFGLADVEEELDAWVENPQLATPGGAKE